MAHHCSADATLDTVIQKTKTTMKTMKSTAVNIFSLLDQMMQ